MKTLLRPFTLIELLVVIALCGFGKLGPFALPRHKCRFRHWSLLVAMSLAAAADAYAQTADSFVPGPNLGVDQFALQTDGKVLVGGQFGTLAGSSRKYIGRLNADGTLDAAFNSTAAVLCNGALAVQTTEAIWASGTFLSGAWLGSVVRLKDNGKLDTNCITGADGYACAILEQPDGRILLGGIFAKVGNQTRNRLARLNADGSLDQDFDPGADGTVYSLALQPDGKIIVGGKFLTIAGASEFNLARLYPDGSLDYDFSPNPNDAVTCITVQPDGKIDVGGWFSNVAGQQCHRLARLNPDGSFDSDFSENQTSVWDAYSMALQADGKLLVAGTLVDVERSVSFSIGRFNQDGSPDLQFQLNGKFNALAVALQADGKILVGGSFEQLAGVGRTNLGRLYNTGPATEALSYDGTNITWLRGGTSPEVQWTNFAWSNDSTNWSDACQGSRVPGGWQLAGIALPVGATLRARGLVAGGQYNGSSWIVESRTIVGRPSILINEGQSSYSADGFSFHISGLKGQTVAIDASPDLSYWFPLSTNVLTAPVIQFLDPSPLPDGRRFYRLRLLE